MAVKGTHGAIILPPDGTGKQVPQSVMQEINYNNGTVAFSKGDTVTFSNSTWTGVVMEVTGTTAVGELHLRILEPVPDPVTLTIGEDILVNAVKNAEVSNLNGGTYYFQQAVIAGGPDLTNTLHIDEYNAAKVRFDGGSPNFDAFGKLQMSTQHKIAEYIMTYNELPNDFTTVTAGSGSLTYMPDMSSVKLTATTASGDSVQRTSDEYHVYQAGISQLLEFTAVVGDSGKTNCTRRAGYYDDDNGVFFELQDTTFNLVLRSKSTGSVVETRIPQSQWNGDRLTGTGGEFNISGLQMDITKHNIWWIDLQWLGAGDVRFGVILNGRRITVHEMRNGGTYTYPYMSTASLPFRYEQFNTGITASTSEFTVTCASVFTEGAFNPFRRAFSVVNTISVTTTSAVPLLAIRPVQTYNGKDNRSTIYPNSFSLYNSSTEVMVFELYRGGTPTDGSYVGYGGESTAELNTTMTAFTGGSVRKSVILEPGKAIEVPFKTFDENRRGLRRKADITSYSGHVYAARLISGTGGGNVTIVLNWDEVRS